MWGACARARAWARARATDGRGGHALVVPLEEHLDEVDAVGLGREPQHRLRAARARERAAPPQPGLGFSFAFSSRARRPRRAAARARESQPARRTVPLCFAAIGASAAGESLASSSRARAASAGPRAAAAGAAVAASL